MKRVLETLDRLIDDNGLYGNPKLTDEAIEDLWKASEAVDKQIPKKPIFNLLYEWFECPECGGVVSFDSYTKYDYCPYCGTKVDWSEEE